MEKYKVDDKKWKLSREYPQIVDTRALDFFMEKKRLADNNDNDDNKSFNCPLVNYTLSCVVTTDRRDRDDRGGSGSSSDIDANVGRSGSSGSGDGSSISRRR